MASAIVRIHEEEIEGVGNGVHGVLRLTQANEDAPTIIEGEIAGLTPGFHGLHITVRGNTSKGTASCGTIFNPFRAKHGNPSNGKDKRKVGGLGNVEANAEGVAKVAIEDALLDLIGPCCVIGRALVVRQGKDDLGEGGNEESTISGNAGPGVGCGVIGIA